MSSENEVLVPRLADRRAVGLAAALVGFVLLFWPTLRGLVSYWAEDPDFSHGFLIPAISAVILYANRESLWNLPVRRSWLGLVVLGASILVFFAGYLSFTNILERLGVWGSLVGAVGFAFGTGVLLAKPFPFIFLLLAIPPPYFLLSPLRLALKSFATRLAADGLSLFRSPAMAEGNVLVVADHRFEVADACSGIRSLMAIFSTAVLFAYLFRTGVTKGLLLTLTALPVTLLVNILRIIVIAVAYTHFDLDLTEGTAHDVVGFAVFGLSLVCLYVSFRFYDWLFRWKAETERGMP